MIINYLDESILKSGNKFEDNIRDYYNQAIIIQKNESINCQTKAETKSIAKELNFPIEFDNKIKKKMFMCKIFGFEDCDFVFKKLDDSHVKYFFI